MRFEVFRVADYEGGVDDCGEGFIGEVAAKMYISLVVG